MEKPITSISDIIIRYEARNNYGWAWTAQVARETAAMPDATLVELGKRTQQDITAMREQLELLANTAEQMALLQTRTTEAAPSEGL